MGQSNFSSLSSTFKNAGMKMGCITEVPCFATWFWPRICWMVPAKTYDQVATLLSLAWSREWISLQHFPDAKVTKKTVFNVTNLSGVSARGSNGALVEYAYRWQAYLWKKTPWVYSKKDPGRCPIWGLAARSSNSLSTLSNSRLDPLEATKHAS
jgi:hypothetical protein